MNDGILISVIINAYNYGIYIEDAIVSALQQTLPRERYEIIIVDDGSTDDTRQRVGKYLPDVIYRFKENGGQASAFNAGIAMARGEFVAFLDADDYWYPEKLREVLTAFSSDSGIDVVYNSMDVVDEVKRPKGVTPQKPYRSFYAGRPVDYSVHHATPVGSATSSIAWRVSAIRELLPIPESYRICADGFLMICAPLVAKKFFMLDKPLGFYRIHGANNYSASGSSCSTVYPRSDEVASYYHRLFLNDLILLSDKFGCKRNVMTLEIKALCLADELVSIKQRYGISRALRSFWNSRIKLADLPLKHRVFRFATICLKLFIPSLSYVKLQHLYVKSRLWQFVQRYVKNDNRSLSD